MSTARRLLKYVRLKKQKGVEKIGVDVFQGTQKQSGEYRLKFKKANVKCLGKIKVAQR